MPMWNYPNMTNGTLVSLYTWSNNTANGWLAPFVVIMVYIVILVSAKRSGQTLGVSAVMAGLISTLVSILMFYLQWIPQWFMLLNILAFVFSAVGLLISQSRD